MICFVGYNLTGSEWHPGLKILTETMQERGLRRETVKFFPVGSGTKAQLLQLKPSVTVALGNAALRSLVSDSPPPVMQSRGYVFEEDFGPVLATVDPADINTNWLPWRLLLSMDLQRAKDLNKNGFKRPLRNVEVV